MTHHSVYAKGNMSKNFSLGVLTRLGFRRRRYFALNGLDRKLEKYLDLDGGFFVELGANDGISQSNTLYFERYRNWRGVLVEPTPHNYLKCLANRAPESHFFCNACVAFDYKEKFVEIVFANLMSSAIGLESDIASPEAHAESGKQFLGSAERVFKFGALARPLNDLLIEAHAPRKIDLLSLDVEGAEIEVLKGIDHARYRFRYICVECRDINAMTIFLKALDYQRIDQLSEHDYLFADVGQSPAP